MTTFQKSVFLSGMKNKHILTPDFFARDTRLVAKDLLGKVLYHQTKDGLYKAVITETEAYHGTEDLACHCSKGFTPRTEVMFGSPGHIYIYLIYGMYQMLNFVTMPKGFPAAVLIRGVSDLQISRNDKPFENLPVKTDGPGKLTKQMQIKRELNRKKLIPENHLWVTDEGINTTRKQILQTKRIGIDYAGEWKDKPWRYFIAKQKERF